MKRNHGVYQDHFVKELRLCHVKTIEVGNTILDSTFIDKLNRKFERSAKNPVSAHRPLGNIDLNQILCWEYKRQIQHDWTFSFGGQTFQIQKAYGSCVKPKSIIFVRKHLDSSITAWYENDKLVVVQ